MAKVRIKWNEGALEEILRSESVGGLLLGRAERIADACNAEPHDNPDSEDGGFLAVGSQGATRARAAVATRTPHAMGHNARHNSLLKNLDKGR